MKKTVLAMSIALFSMAGTTHSVMAAEEAKKTVAKAEPKHDTAFMTQLAHASFMPTIVKHIKTNKTTLGITEAQMAEIKKYHEVNAPYVHRLVKLINETEDFAHQMALDNFPPQQVAEVGMKTLKMRHALMVMKLKCRSFIKSILSPEQYKEALTTYNGKSSDDKTEK